MNKDYKLCYVDMEKHLLYFSKSDPKFFLLGDNGPSKIYFIDGTFSYPAKRMHNFSVSAMIRKEYPWICLIKNLDIRGKKEEFLKIYAGDSLESFLNHAEKNDKIKIFKAI
jgi:hypothetical protein